MSLRDVYSSSVRIICIRYPLFNYLIREPTAFNQDSVFCCFVLVMFILYIILLVFQNYKHSAEISYILCLNFKAPDYTAVAPVVIYLPKD